jgi:hypothetical protein
MAERLRRAGSGIAVRFEAANHGAYKNFHRYDDLTAVTEMIEITSNTRMPIARYSSLVQHLIELFQECHEIPTRELACVQASLGPELDDFALVGVRKAAAAAAIAATRRG